MSVHKLKTSQIQKEYNALKEEFQALLRSAVVAILRTLEQKDPYTYNHVIRVSEYALMLGRALNLPKKQLVALELGAVLHDIGKIGVPDDVLLKPGRLSEQEYEVMKTHPNKSAEILKGIEALKEVVPVVQHHQEHFDGTGYPAGLKGEQIPQLARICFIADAFDAMTSDRPYRKALSDEVAFSELEKYANKQYDPKYVKVFIKTYKKQKFDPHVSEFFHSEARKKAVGE